MSRGGRGGGRGGRGGASQRGKIGGLDITWEHDPDIDKAVDKGPTGDYPDIRIPASRPPNRVEKTSIAKYRALRSRIHEGPLYTVLNVPTVGTGKGMSNDYGMADPFEGMPSYSQKFQRQRRKIPKLDTRPYVMRFFPEELWKTLDPKYNSEAETNGTISQKKTKRLQISKGSRMSRLEELDNQDDDERNVNGEDEDMEKDPDDEEEEEQDGEENFEDDESADDDYNAEQYFDDGEDDGFEDDDMGGGDDTYE